MRGWGAVRRLLRVACALGVALAFAGTAMQAASLASPWVTQDIGSVNPAGTASVNGSVYTLTGGGIDIWNNADAFRFAYQVIAGDAEIVARVPTLTNPHPWTKAGIMIRDDQTPGGKNVALLVS